MTDSTPSPATTRADGASGANRPDPLVTATHTDTIPPPDDVLQTPASTTHGSPWQRGAAGVQRWEHAIASGATNAARNVDTYVRVYPWGAIVASAAVGLVVGLALMRS
ncbi:hypothetical protein [Caldimonas brevitalea]|uniref:hypothetical protein n=1 Tax=Caldimonas brevitalea TaxID=413882 RepID=UPI0012FCE710|nr:hypothetical protein [Caldimonas brevitalea]